MLSVMYQSSYLHHHPYPRPYDHQQQLQQQQLQQQKHQPYHQCQSRQPIQMQPQQQDHLRDHKCVQENQSGRGLQCQCPMIFLQELPILAQSSAFSDSAVQSEEDFEDVDEDEISDMDEEEELRISYEQYRQNIRKQPDVTSQLLQFADLVSADIRKFFGRTKEQDDACDVYEDKWATTKSGRELYYADLLRIAQGEAEPTRKSIKQSRSSILPSSSLPLSPDNDSDNKSQFTGQMNMALGMGPLTELFEYGLHNIVQRDKKHRLMNTKSKQSSLLSTLPSPTQQSGFQAIPMRGRNFPESFWREPKVGKGSNLSDSSRLEISQQNMLTSSKLPDFSDLVESWQGGTENLATVGDTRVRTDSLIDNHRL